MVSQLCVIFPLAATCSWDGHQDGAHLGQNGLRCRQEQCPGQGRKWRCISLGLMITKCRNPWMALWRPLPLFCTLGPFLLLLFVLERADHSAPAASRTRSRGHLSSSLDGRVEMEKYSSLPFKPNGAPGSSLRTGRRH